MIRAGYGRTPREVGRYTWRQMKLFFHEEQEEDRRRRRAQVVDNNVAAVGGKTVTKHLKDLE